MVLRRNGRFFGFAVITVFLILVCVPDVWGDWLEISGEKGFSLNYDNQNDGNQGLEQGFQFNQSLTLDLKGGFGEGYLLDGHLVDQSNSPLQLFVSLKGKQAGLLFGDGNLNAFSTPLTGWNSQFNGLDAYWQNERHQLRAAYANPTGIAVKESLRLEAGHNYGYLSYRPLKAGTLTVTCEGRTLTEGVDYTVDYLSGELKLLFFVSNAAQLDLNYQYIPDSVLGNRFLAVHEQSVWKNFRLGVDYFGSHSQEEGGPLLLGESKIVPTVDLIGINGGFDLSNWHWDLEYWVSRESSRKLRWDYLDSMDGTETESEAFTGSAQSQHWSVTGSGSGYLTIAEVAAVAEPEHTRENNPSLILDYRLQRTGDTVGIYHDFRTYRDFSYFSKLSSWVYLNGQNLELELAVITSENNYYFRKFTTKDLGWHRFDLELDPARLEQMGLPDLKKIRYLKISLSSSGGDAISGRLYLAPLLTVGKSLAGQRWSVLKSTPGSSIAVSTASEAVPGQAADNQVLQLDYHVAENGWACVTYHPTLALNLTPYRAVKLYLNTPGAVRVTLLATRGGTDYALGQFQAATGGAWQEFSLELTGLPAYILGKVEALTLKLDQASGIGQLKVDAICAVDRVEQQAGALKGRGEYNAGPWRNLVELDQYQAGFRSLDTAYRLANRSMRNLTEYTREQWQVRSDLQFYEKADLASGYPIAGQSLVLAVKRKETVFSLDLQADETEPGSAETTGNRLESGLGIMHQAGPWNFDFQKRWVDNTLTGDTSRQSDALQVKYTKNYWTGWTRLWQDTAADKTVQTRQFGNNLGLNFDPPGINRFQLNGGMVDQTSAGARSTRNYWQSEMALELSRWLEVNGMYKFEDRLENTTGISNDRLTGLGLNLLPLPGLNLRFNLQSRTWEELESGDSAQRIWEGYLDYNRNELEKISLFYRQEDLNTVSALNTGARMGVNGEVVVWKPWLTQLGVEINTGDSHSIFDDSRQRAYKTNVKNTRQVGSLIYYWGVWEENIRQDGNLPDWQRRMGQAGLEYHNFNYWEYGIKLDLGREKSKENPGTVWGTGVFVSFDNAQTFFQVNIRYQTYTTVLWKAGLDYRIFKGNSFSVNWHNDYLLDRETGRDLLSSLDLRFYFR